MHSFYGQYLASVEKSHAAALVELDSALKIDPHYMPAFYHLGRIASWRTPTWRAARRR